MAWPYDARYKTFAANNEISSAFLNDVQDKIIDLREPQWIEHSGYSCEETDVGGGVYKNSWVMTNDLLYGYKCITADTSLYLFWQVRDDAIITDAAIKLSVADVATSLTLYAMDCKYGSSSTAPTATTIKHDHPAGTGISVVSLTPASEYTVASGFRVILEVDTCDASDYVYSARIKVKPAT